MYFAERSVIVADALGAVNATPRVCKNPEQSSGVAALRLAPNIAQSKGESSKPLVCSLW
jgi:hypothetical protein